MQAATKHTADHDVTICLIQVLNVTIATQQLNTDTVKTAVMKNSAVKLSYEVVF